MFACRIFTENLLIIFLRQGVSNIGGEVVAGLKPLSAKSDPF
jgi:hypothetical protein